MFVCARVLFGGISDVVDSSSFEKVLCTNSFLIVLCVRSLFGRYGISSCLVDFLYFSFGFGFLFLCRFSILLVFFFFVCYTITTLALLNSLYPEGFGGEGSGRNWRWKGWSWLDKAHGRYYLDN